MRMTIQRPIRKAMDQRGFTLIELLVATALTVILVAVVYGMLISFKKAVISQESSVEIQQGSRFTAGKLKRDLELIGAKVKSGNGQRSMIFAGGWELLYNGEMGNVAIAEDGTQMVTGELIPGNTIKYGGSAYTFYGGRPDGTGGYEAFDSDAETVHYKMHTPDPLSSTMGSKDYSFHDDDRELRRWINGSDHMSTVVGVGVRTGYDVEGGSMMPYEDGANVQPLFKYWGDWDFDPTTPDTLWGDASTDGLLSSGEIAALMGGSFSLTFTGPTGNSVVAGSVAGGGISLTGGGSFLSNSEDIIDEQGALDAGEDLNRNGRLDINLLDTQLHRVEIDLGVIAQNPGERGQTFAHGSIFPESRITSNVFLRNIGELVDNTGGKPPAPPTNCTAAAEECGESVKVEFTASADDGMGEQDVTWYAVLRMGIRDSDDDDTDDDTFDAGSPIFNLYTNIPAQGIDADGNLRTYEYYDYNVEAGYCYQYKIIAIDVADQRSAACTTNTVCLTGPNSPVPAPGDIEVWDSPCHISNNDFGSMTVMWQQSMNGGIVDPTIDEYWIYRSHPNNVNTFVRIAKVPVAEADDSCLDLMSHAECAIGFDVIHAECKCRDEDYYPWVDSAGVKWLVWRDQEESPGLEGLPPLHGAAFGITTTSPYDESSINQYYYQVKAHRSTDGCQSDYIQYSPECFAEGQSFNSSKDSTATSRYSPPWNVQVNDVSDYIYDGEYQVNTAKFKVSWAASPSEFCEYTNALANAEIPDLTRYYIYRSKTPQQNLGGHLASIMLEEDSSSPPIITPEFNNDAPAQILVYHGRVRGGKVNAGSVWHGYDGYEESSTGSGIPNYYSWVDSDQRITDADVWHIVTGGTFRLQPQVFGNPVQGFDADFVMPGIGTMLDPIYEYMVAAVSANDTLNYPSGYPVENPTPKGPAEWSVGPSCVEYASFGCACFFGVESVSIDYCSLVTPSSTDDVDAIEVRWRWSGNAEPVDEDDHPITDGVDLVYNIQAPANKADDNWHLAEVIVQEGNSLDCGFGAYPSCVGYHYYEDFEDAVGNPGYGLVYQYGVKMKCNSGIDSCTRIQPLAISEQAGFPDESHICYKSQHPAGSPDCADTSDFLVEYINAGGKPTGANCQTGEVRIELREMFNSCGGLVETDEDWVWWRVVRFSTSEPADAYGIYPWPLEPEIGNYECVKSDPTCGEPPTHDPAWPCQTAIYSSEAEYVARHECFGTMHYTGYWLRIGEGNFVNPGDTFDYAVDSSHMYAYPNVPSLTFVDNAAGIRRFMFAETLNPNLNYQYVFTIGIKHPPRPPQDVTNRPNCLTQPGLIGGDQCNGGFDGRIYTDAPNKYTVIVDFANKDQCYPPRSGIPAGDSGPPFPAAEEARDTLQWNDNPIEGNTKPWKSWEWSWTLFHWTIWNPFGTDWVIDWTIGDHAFEYSGSYLRSDIDGMFGGLTNWIFQYLYDLGFELCDWCVEMWGIQAFCVQWFWPTCHQDLTNLRNHNYLWSNFYPPVCGSNTTGNYHNILYDYMAQMHLQTTEKNITLNMAIHGSFTPWDLSHQLLNLEMGFKGAGTMGTRLTHIVANEYQTVGTANTLIGTDDLDDDWYSVFYLVCMNRVNPAFYGETFLYFWHKRDNAGKSHDWKTDYSENMYNMVPTLTWTSDGRANTLNNRWVPLPEPEAQVGCNCNRSGARWQCPTNQPLRCVLPPKGAFGFWAEPFVDVDVTEYRYDNIRITPYCGKCPPDHLWAATQAALSAPIEPNATGNFSEDY